MRNLVVVSALLVLVLVVVACSGGDTTNPTKLWLAPDGSERAVKLQVEEPAPF